VAGVQVEVGEKQAAIDLDIIVEYGASIVDLAHAVRRNVIGAVERMTGLEMIEVNIAVSRGRQGGAGRAGAPARRVTAPHPPSTGAAAHWTDRRRHG
jgi:Asp23 family, cell envelope-related function